VVERREGEEDIWREILAMKPRMTTTTIDEFIKTPSNIAVKREFEQLQRDLYLRTARACADARRPDDTPLISNAEWRTMQLEEEWVKYTASNPGADVLQDRAQRVLSLLRTLSHTDQKAYIGWTIRRRASLRKSNALVAENRALKKRDKRL